jgi:hypothetical protein
LHRSGFDGRIVLIVFLYLILIQGRLRSINNRLNPSPTSSRPPSQSASPGRSRLYGTCNENVWEAWTSAPEAHEKWSVEIDEGKERT